MSTYRVAGETYYVLVLVTIFMGIVTILLYAYSVLHMVFGGPTMFGRASAFLLLTISMYVLTSSMIDITPEKIRSAIYIELAGVVAITVYTVVFHRDFSNIALSVLALIICVVAMALFSYSVEKSRGKVKNNGMYHQ